MIVILQHKTTKKSLRTKLFGTNIEFINKIHYVSCNTHSLNTSKDIVVLRDFTTDTIYVSFSIACVTRCINIHRNTISSVSFLLDVLDVEDIIVTSSTSFIIYRYISLGLVRLPYTKAVRRSSA